MSDSRTSAQHELGLMTQPAIWLCAIAGALLMAGGARAANDPENLTVPSDSAALSASQAYAHDKAYCMSSAVTENRSLCLKEASRAYQEAKAGILEPGSQVASTHHRRHMAKAASTSTTTSTSGTSSTDQTKP